jgi:CcmD family protein
MAHSEFEIGDLRLEIGDDKMGYLVAAYAVFWGLTFVYVFSIAHRQRNLAQEIQALKRALGGEAQSE